MEGRALHLGALEQRARIGREGGVREGCIGKALALFDRAVQVAPDNVSVRYQIGLSLAGFDPEKYHDRIAAEFRAAIAAKPATAYEKAIQARAARLAALLTARPGGDFAALVRKFEGYP